MAAVRRLPVVRELSELAELIRDGGDVYLRHSGGPDADAQQVSRDYESGLELPGLSVVPLTPPSWWSRPSTDWLARQVCKYAQLSDGAPDRYAWVLTGRLAGLGPDQEPLIADAQPLAVLDDSMLGQARRLYRERFEIGRDSRS